MIDTAIDPTLPHGIFFDMDGLLVDTEPFWLETEREVMLEFDVQWREADQLYCLGGPMSKVGQYMSDLANGRQTPEWFADELIERMADKFQTIRLMPGIKDLLSEVSTRQIPAALVSASPRRLVNAVLTSITNHPFQLSISSDDVRRGKPFPDPYLKAATDLEVSIGHSLILEDSPTGVTAARSSGGWVVAVPHIAEIAPAPRSAIVSTLAGHSVDSLWKLVREIQ